MGWKSYGIGDQRDINDKRGSRKSIALKYNIPRTTLIVRRHIATASARKKCGRYKFTDYLIKDWRLINLRIKIKDIFWAWCGDFPENTCGSYNQSKRCRQFARCCLFASCNNPECCRWFRENELVGLQINISLMMLNFASNNNGESAYYGRPDTI